METIKEGSAKRQSIGIRAKLITIFVLIKVIPLLLLAWFLFYQLQGLTTIIEHQVTQVTQKMAADIVEVGDKATTESIKSLDDSARHKIEQLTRDTSSLVAHFLYERDNDILQASQIELSEQSFKAFLNSKQKDIIYHPEWVLSPDQKKWIEKEAINHKKEASVTPKLEENKKEFHYQAPLVIKHAKKMPVYLEMTLVDLKGKELLKVTTSPLVSNKLHDISNPYNTYIHAENYFADLKSLKAGEIYVSNVIGAYIPSPIIGPYTPQTAQKKGVEFKPELAAYAGKENPVGKRFQGIVRWATPVVKNGQITSYITLALDHTHLMEFTDHLLPTEQRFSDISDASSGNYAFMWDNLGRNISHPRDYFIVGYDPNNGEPVMPWLEDSLYKQWKQSGLSTSEFLATTDTFQEQGHDKKPSIDMIKKGQIALDCRFLNFAPQCTGWNNLTQYGGSGSFVIYWSKLWKLTTAATIPYYTGQYGQSKRGFGFVTIGANIDQFHQPAIETKQRLDLIISEQTQKSNTLKNKLFDLIQESMSEAYVELTLSTILMSLMVILIAIWIASYITRQITQIIRGISRFQHGELNFRLPVETKDEIGKLTSSFNSMAESIETSFYDIKATSDKLKDQNEMNENLVKKMGLEITQRKVAQKRLNQLAYFDSLTQLANRSQLSNELSHIKEYASHGEETLALLFIDLDGFKDVNDTLGHSIGDKLLLEVANRLKHHSRSEDFIARLGGDEFTIVVHNIPNNTLAASIAQKVIDTLSEKFRIENNDIYISASIGIALFSNYDMDEDSIMKDADTAMYHAKEQGKSCYRFCTKELNEKLVTRMRMANDLRKALANNEFILYYQPKVDTLTSRIIGLEALIRWEHPNDGLVPPIHFIPIAEETGLILEIGEWVINEACQQIQQWEKQGFTLVPIAVNVSAKQFTKSDIVGSIKSLLSKTKVDAELLEVELTESLVMEQPEKTIKVLQELHDLGVSSSIDDFGTGYSSLAYLKLFPVNSLKIDQSFVRDLETDPNDVALAKSIVSMAHNMGLKVIAEGVENKQQQEILKDMQCDNLQGYLFSKPLAAPDIEHWLKN